MPETDFQVLWQQIAMLAAVAVAAAWLTARWLIRRRQADCGGSCARCTGAAACEKAANSIPRSEPIRGVRPASLRVMPSTGADPAHAFAGNPPLGRNLSGPADV